MRKGPLEDDLQYIAKYPLQYEQLKETTVLVTGATGLIGASIVRALIAVEGIHIIALVRNIEKANKLIDKQNRQRRGLARSVGLTKLKETKGGISTNISVRQALSVLKDDRGGFFEPVHHINIQSYRYPKQLDNRIESLKENTKKKSKKITSLCWRHYVNGKSSLFPYNRILIFIM